MAENKLKTLFILFWIFLLGSTSFGDSENIVSDAKECEKIDLMIIVDGSGSVTPNNFEKVKMWIKKLADTFRIEDGNVQIGVVQYSHWYRGRSIEDQPFMRTEIELGKLREYTTFRVAVDKIKYQGYTTYTAHAINKTVNYDFQGSGSRYPQAQRVMIVVTDGNSTDSQDLPGSVQHATDAGVVIFAVGIGRSNVRELLIMTGDRRDRVFSLKNFDELENIVDQIKQGVVCDCDPDGSLGMCDPCTRQCTCKPNAAGRRCETCAAGFFKLNSVGICQACKCDVRGTVNGNECTQDDSDCVCLPNVVGKKCDTCADGYYGMVEGRGCEPCNCLSSGAAGQVCNKETGSCE